MTLKPEYFRVNSDFFIWTGKVGICDITDLPPEMPFHKDASEPFDVVSSKTGKVRHFFFQAPMYDRESELVGWQYRSEGGEFIIQIIND